MSRLDRAKELIGYLKVIFGILVAIDVSLVAWLFQHANKIDDTKIILVSASVLMVTFALVYANKNILKKIDELEEM